MFCPFLENKLSFVLLEAASNCDSSDKHVQLMNVRLNLTMYCLFVKFFPTLFIFLSSPVIKTTFDHDPIRSNKRSFVKYVEKCHWNYVSFKSNEYRISSTKRSRILYKIPPMQKKKKRKKKWYPWNQENKLVVYLFELCFSNTRFFISNIFMRKTWLKLAKNKAKAKQRPEAIWKLFTFFIHHLRYSNLEYSENVINSFMTKAVII